METLQNIFQAEIIQKLGWTLAHFVWQATTIALILAAILKLLHKSSGNLRYIITCMALALIAVMPAVTIRMIDVSSNIIVPIKQTTVESPKADTDTQMVLEIPAIEPTIKIAASSRIPLKDKFIEIIEPALPYSVASWFVGVFGLSLWHLGGWRQLQKLRKKMTKNVPYEIAATAKKLSRALGIKKAVSIAESALVEVPTVIGHLKPIILLPASALTGLSVQQIEAILAHELAHIKRHDYLVNILQTVVEILGFYHPAVWWVSHKIRAERENCCDDIAVNLCSDKICYARALTTMEEIRTGKLSLAVAASGGNLLMRIRRLLGKESASEGKLSWLPSVITILLIVALLIPTALALNSKPKPVLANVGTNNLIHLISVTPEEITIERLASICECMESSIIDIAVDYEWYRDPPVKPGNIAGTGILTTIGTEKHHWSTARPFSDFSLTSMSANFTNGSGNTFRSTTKQSYDGKIGKYLQVIKRPNKSFSTADSIITKSRRFMKTKSLSPETFSIFHFRKEGPISKILKMGYPLEIELNKDVDIINGFNTIHTVVSKKIEDGRKILIYRIYFAVEQGYTPVRFEHSNGREIVYRVDVTKLKKVSKGLWYPAGGRLGAIKENYSNFYKANKIIINQGIGANYFDLEFPQGTKVIDEINNTEFIVRPTKKQKEKFDKEQEYIKKHADEIKAEREDGGRIYSAAMLYKLGITKYIYFTDNNKNLPKRLGDLKSYLNDETFSWLSKNIIYLGVKEKLSEIDPAKTPLAYDKTLLMQENSQGTNILYSDSRVVFAKTEALKELGIKAEQSGQIEIQTRFLMISPDANEITKFFEEESIKAALINDNGGTDLKSYILSNEQGQELLGLVRNNPDSKTLTAPRVTVLNGESTTIKIQKDAQYTETAEDSGQPEEKELTIGTTFQVKPTLQNDGREILLDFEFEHISLLGFEDGLPQTEIANIKSRVSVPDGGTLLVGGQKITDDQNEQKILLCLIKAVQSESGS
ncbi:MAG: M48 family metalloprotease [Planctomycetes bacterium]|nr:M48 family metalloprotease [Planctomycetota bacterium]